MKRYLWVIACLIPLVLGSFFVLHQPGRVEKDAYEYYALAQSIHQGRFYLDGQPSMIREPGYPAFLALLGLISFSPVWILWVQVGLLGVNALIIGDAIRRIEPRVGWWPGIAAGCAYGLAAMAAQQMLEVWTALLISTSAWLLSRFFEKHAWRWLVGMNIALAALVLTRSTLTLLVPLFVGSASYALFQDKKDLKKTLLAAALSFLMIAGLVFPWVWRNHEQFHRWSLSTRAGGQVYVRVWKAAQSWKQFGDTVASVFIGRGLQSRWMPKAQPITNQQWLAFNDLYDGYHAQGLSVEDMQPLMAKQAVSWLVSSPAILIRSGLWSGIDLLRLLALPSPRSPTFPIEFTFSDRAQRLTSVETESWSRLFLLWAIHLGQLVWWGLIAWMMWVGFWQYKGRYLPGLILVALCIAHAPADNIIRYALPIHPWILAGMVWIGIVSWLSLRTGKKREE